MTTTPRTRTGTTPRARKPTPAWELIEQIAAKLEQALTPAAKVEHNVRLPVLGRTRRRQCDVVVTYGEEPRQTRAIVEVQERGRRRRREQAEE